MNKMAIKKVESPGKQKRMVSDDIEVLDEISPSKKMMKLSMGSSVKVKYPHGKSGDSKSTCYYYIPM